VARKGSHNLVARTMPWLPFCSIVKTDVAEYCDPQTAMKFQFAMVKRCNRYDSYSFPQLGFALKVYFDGKESFVSDIACHSTDECPFTKDIDDSVPDLGYISLSESGTANISNIYATHCLANADKKQLKEDTKVSPHSNQQNGYDTGSDSDHSFTYVSLDTATHPDALRKLSDDSDISLSTSDSFSAPVEKYILEGRYVSGYEKPEFRKLTCKLKDGRKFEFNNRKNTNEIGTVEHHRSIRSIYNLRKSDPRFSQLNFKIKSEEEIDKSPELKESDCITLISAIYGIPKTN
jgi:hypothetical protein